MATKKRPVPPKPNPKPKPTGPRKDGKAGPKPKAKSGGFGRAEDQITRAIGSGINTAGKGIRGVATGVDKAVTGYASGVRKVAGGVGKIVSSAYSGGAAPGTFMGPAPKPKPKRSMPLAAAIGQAAAPKGGYTQRQRPEREGGPFEPRGGKRRTKPKLPKSM
jgi:hypothetical protein